MTAPVTEAAIILGMAAVTFAVRYSPWAFSQYTTLSPLALRALAYVPPVVLTAIIVPAVLIPDGVFLEASWHNPRLVGSLVAIAVAVWTRNLLLTIVLGMVSFLGWQIVLRH